MRAYVPAAILGTLIGCVQGDVANVAGNGVAYYTRCSGEMAIDGTTYTARCTPLSCEADYTDAGISHVVVAVDPGKKVVGYAERVCLQDLSDVATAIIQSARTSNDPAPPL